MNPMSAAKTAYSAYNILRLLQRRKLLGSALSMVIIFGIIMILFFLMVIGAISNVLDVNTGFKSGEATDFAYQDIPANLMPIFLKAQEDYGVSWAVLAAICKIETEFGGNVAVSDAGAIGFMQFMPATWEHYKVDGDEDGIYDPYNPHDAIPAAANLLSANKFATEPRNALYRYNNAWWYVDKVLNLAMEYSTGMMPVSYGLWPVPGYTEISSPFGPRWGRMHQGIDIAAPIGAPVMSAINGQVTLAGWNGGYGLCVIVTNSECSTLYAHLSEVLVSKGERVSAGEHVGLVGNTGNSTGPHLHFEVHVNNRPCNPEQWLAENSNY